MAGIKPRRSGPQCDKLLICTGSSRLTQLLLPKDRHSRGTLHFALCPARASQVSPAICHAHDKTISMCLALVKKAKDNVGAHQVWQTSPTSCFGHCARAPCLPRTLRHIHYAGIFTAACMSTRSVIREGTKMAQCSLQQCFMTARRLLHMAPSRPLLACRIAPLIGFAQYCPKPRLLRR